MALLKLLQIRCICRIYCLFNCPQVNPPEAKFSCSFQELNLSLLEFVVDVKREYGLCLPLRYGAERSEAEGGCDADGRVAQADATLGRKASLSSGRGGIA